MLREYRIQASLGANIDPPAVAKYLEILEEVLAIEGVEANDCVEIPEVIADLIASKDKEIAELTKDLADKEEVLDTALRERDEARNALNEPLPIPITRLHMHLIENAERYRREAQDATGLAAELDKRAKAMWALLTKAQKAKL